LEVSDRAGAPVVVVLSELAARTFFPGEDAIGKRITMRDWNDPLPAEVVGIAADVHQRALDQPIAPAVYFSHAQFADRTYGMNVLLRTSVAPSSVIASAAERVWAVDKDQPLSNLRTLDEVMTAGVAQQRFNTLVLGIFAGLGLMLALVGIYGVTSYAVNERTQEIGIRMALGADRAHILRLVLAQGMLPVAVGVVLGVAGALATARFLQSLLFNVQPTDAASYVTVALTLTGVALLACAIPARRAARVDPMVALRYE
jgi:putative ABC transport system permease protein